VAKLCGDRPTQLRDLAIKKKEKINISKRHHEKQPETTVPGGLIIFVKVIQARCRDNCGV